MLKLFHPMKRATLKPVYTLSADGYRSRIAQTTQLGIMTTLLPCWVDRIASAQTVYTQYVASAQTVYTQYV